MKRGFLNTEKAKRKIDPVTNSPNAHDITSTKTETRIPGSVATSHSQPLFDPHSIPQSIMDSMNYPSDRHRFVFRQWPRDPKGKIILPSNIHGKEAGNGLELWAATLYDFYFVQRVPDIPNALTISTASKLKKVMESFGELDHAKDELAWAEREEDPKEILPWDPAQAIEAYERRILSHDQLGAKERNGECQRTPPSASLERRDAAAGEAFDAAEPPAHPLGSQRNPVGTASDVAFDDGETGLAGTPTMAANGDTSQQLPGGTSSPPHTAHYPSPWPFVPFEAPSTPFTLHRGIPTHLLPKKLHVHDPWNLVQVSTVEECEEDDEDEVNDVNKVDESWTSRNDNVLTYTLSLPPESQKAVDKAAQAAAAAEDEALKRGKSIFIPPQDFEGPTEEPAICAILPQRPRKLTEVPEAHLYLSPKGKLGRGNHSAVHAAEWELPRALFCESTICDDCFHEQVQLEIERLKESGEWARRLEVLTNEYQSNRSPEKASTDTVSVDGKSTSTEPAPQRKTVGFVKVTIESKPTETLELVGTTKPGEAPQPSLCVARVSDQVINRRFEYEGPIIKIYPNVKWQDPSLPSTICKHQTEKKKPVPPTATFRVAAKLSIPGDSHLAREARNYLEFPAHFFQHWNGYNIIPPLHDPTPVGALVPQFFGYYTCDSQPDGPCDSQPDGPYDSQPDDPYDSQPDSPCDSQPDRPYRSPILLIEHCGQPINAKTLSTDDRHECAALLFRFHSAGWLHESFAERNILMQKGQPTRNPLEEEHKGDRRYSFRLIDFGRSLARTQSSSRAGEESRGKELFGIL